MPYAPLWRALKKIAGVARLSFTRRICKLCDVFKCPHCGRAISDQSIYAHAGRTSARKILRKLGPDYYRWLQSKRRRRRGGRPPKK